MSLLERAAAHAGLGVGTADVGVGFTHSLELCAEVDAFPAEVEGQAVGVARDEAADDLLVAVVDLVVMVVIFVDKVARAGDLVVLGAFFVHPVGLFLRLHDTKAFEQVE